MTREAFERGDWQAVIEAYRLESYDAADWLRYGFALLHTLQPGPEAGKQQQQEALAFLQAQRDRAAAQLQSVLAKLHQALKLVGISRVSLAAESKAAASPSGIRQTCSGRLDETL